MNDHPHWVPTIPVSVLQKNRCHVFRFNGKQIALFDTEKGFLACNNRCPHQAYPLSEGSLDKECVLTCNWHNWKFNLVDGKNLFEGDNVRVYPVDIRDGMVWIDIADIPFDVQYPKLMRNLRRAMQDNSYDRMARELARLQLLGAKVEDVVAEAIEWTHRCMRYGWTHAYAGAADWLTLHAEQATNKTHQLIATLELVGHIADDTLRESEYPFTAELVDYDETAFLEAVESESEEPAVALVCAALNQGLHFGDLEETFSRAALAHYNDFGHALIYLTKAGYLIERLGQRVELPLLLSLVRTLVFATREDKVPMFRGYATALTDWNRSYPTDNPTWPQFKSLSIDKALTLTASTGESDPEQLFDSLLKVNANHMLAYDLSLQEQTHNSIDDNISWLNFTHAITFADAVQQQCTKFPDLWSAGLLQLACFAGRNQPHTDYEQPLEEWLVDDCSSFYQEHIEALFDHGKTEFIVSVHLLKTLLAARRLSNLTDEASARMLTAAMNRFLHSPYKRKHVARTVHQALQLVGRGD